MKPCPDTFPFPLVALDETASTNQYLSQLCNQLQESVAELTTVTAEFQTAGKGQRGNTWEAEEGKNLLFSFVLYPSFLEARRQFILSQIVSLAIKEELSRWSDEITIKWPNDIFVDGKKLGGVLAEMVPLAATPIADGTTGTTDVAAATERVGIVFGIGLNLAVPEDHLPTDKATSLQLVAHGLPDSMTLRDMIAAHLVDGLRSRLADFEADPQREATRAMEEMRPVCWTLGKPCEAHFVDGTTLRGTALELNPDASLTIRDDNGNLHTVRTADVGVLPQ